MTAPKRNKSVARLIIVLGTLITGLGIWYTMNQLPVSTSSAATAEQVTSITDPNFSANDTFLNQPPIQTQPVPTAPQVQSPSVQTAPVQTAPAPTPTQNRRLRTRGS